MLGFFGFKIIHVLYCTRLYYELWITIVDYVSALIVSLLFLHSLYVLLYVNAFDVHRNPPDPYALLLTVPCRNLLLHCCLR